MKSRWSRWLWVGSLVLSSVAFADTCAEVVGATPRVNRTFKFTVLDHNKQPKSGVRVELGTLDRYNAMHPVASGVTDNNGVLNFVAVKPGNLTFQMTDRSGERQWSDIEVIGDGGESSADFSWPYVNWLPLRSATGFLLDQSEPMRHWNVTLETFPDGAQIAFSDTDNQGRFDLPADRPGRYYIELSQTDSNTGGTRSIGRVPVNVTLDEHYPAVDAIFVQSSECGLKYDQFCTLKKATLDSLCLRTVDAKGNGIAAHARIFSKHGSVGTSEINAGEHGDLNLPPLSAGDYELQIFDKGYTPVRRTVTVQPGAQACTTPALIPLNPLGMGCAIETPAAGKGN